MTQSPSPGWTPDHHRAPSSPWRHDEPHDPYRHLASAREASPGADVPSRHAASGHAGSGQPGYGWGTEPTAQQSRQQQPEWDRPGPWQQPQPERTGPWQQHPERTGRSNAAEWFTRPTSPAWTPGPSWRQDEPARDAPAGTRPAGLSALIRGQAVDRMRRANRNHVRAGLENLGTARACGPYCLTLLSVERRGFARISLASRLDDDDPDHYDLAELLADVYAEARVKRTEARRAGRAWDPRTPLEGLVLRSEDLNEHTELIGVGVSMLDLPDLPWVVAKRSWEKTWQGDRAMASTKLGGQTKLWLVDGTAIHTVRHEDGPDEISTTATVDIARPARLDPDLVTRDTAQGDLTWERLKQLLDILTES